MRKTNEHKARDKRRLLAETLPAPRRVAVSPFVPWVSWRSFGFLQCVMLLQLIFAWDFYVCVYMLIYMSVWVNLCVWL